MNFTKEVEKLINPMDVGALHFIQFFNKFLPKPIQEKLIKASAKKIPFMGFVVEPYATFLCYEIENIEQANKLLPKGFTLIKTKILKEDEPKYYCIFGCFTAHTSAFWGSRAEFYIIAEDSSTGLLSWIIVDYDTNTISYDKRDGLKSPNSKAVVTTNYTGTVFVEILRNDKSRNLVFKADTTSGVKKALDERLWLEGNLSIGYGSNFGEDSADIFSLKFEAAEVESALYIPLDKINLDTNTWYPGLFKQMPTRVLSFPYAQHFISDAPGASSKIRNKEELAESINQIDFKNIKTLSTDSFKIMFLAGSLISSSIIVILILILVFR